jgi:dephospho-CoA kinase
MVTKVIGLAGRPGCGKSAVARALAGQLGVEAIDLDKVAWETYVPGTKAYDCLVARFGRRILGDDGRIDRGKLAELALSNSAVRRDLETIVHPAVIERLDGLVRSAKRRGVGTLLVEGALLASSPYVDRSIFDAVLWLEASEETRRNRLRSDAREGHADRMDAVSPDAATIVIDAEGTVFEVTERVWRSIEGQA